MAISRFTAIASLVLMVFAATAAIGAERQWQQGVWRDVQIERPKVSFGIGTRDPSRGNLPPAIREIRTYVIETDDLRLELKETTTADAPRIEATIGESVTFAVEKNTVYIKLSETKERKLSVVKKSAP
jgi:hypothetical protein